MSPQHVTLIHYGEEPLAQLASDILKHYSDCLPDLTSDTTGAVILLAEAHAAKRLRHLLLEQAKQQGIHALLCPRISNIRDWAKQQFNQHMPLPHDVCGQHQRELILFDALTQYQSLLGSGSPWHLTDDLLKLFDELTLNLKQLPESYEEFENEIAQAYGINASEFPSLGREASLVYTLWHAWHTQLKAEQLFDSEAAYLLGLQAGLKHSQDILYIAGYHQFEEAEKNWLVSLIEQKRGYLYLHGQVNSDVTEDISRYHPDTPTTVLSQFFSASQNSTKKSLYTQFINSCYENNHSHFLQRSSEFAKNPDTEIKQRLSLLFSKGHEEQAHVVELQVRRWLLEGKKNIGIVTENRRLARRVRALLERADVPLQDLAGWALSTTRAGAVLERWLECIEEDFSHLPLLDILKSPFIFSQFDPQQVKLAAYRLEHDIIRQENIATSLSRYIKTIHSRTERLQWSSEETEILLSMLTAFEEANSLLAPLLKGRHTAKYFIEQLSQSLLVIGMTPLLEDDAAGIRIIEMLDTLKHSADKYSLELSWSDFRTWLGRSLEHFVFSPDQTGSPVCLMGLAQSRLQNFDALIIASAEHEHLPGKTNLTPFFNNAVRQQLHIATTHAAMTERFHHFRRLLESSPHILITANHEENGEEVPLSPWLEIIHRFYEQSYEHSLEDNELKQLAAEQASYVIRCEETALPVKTSQAKAVLTKELVPKYYSPSSYQKLMDCPYQFFAAHALQLSPSEEVQEALSKSDYGERVHKCLEAFHQNVNWLSGPFTERLTEQNKEQATTVLNEISQQVFARDVADSFEHSGWLEKWLQLVPDYIDWQIKNSEQQQFQEAEHKTKITWKNNIDLSGRLDRIDKNADGLSIVDYKTGKSASRSEIDEGEAVQLPFYALLAETEFKQTVNQVSYLNLDKNVKTGTKIDGDELDNISHHIGERLVEIVEQMQNGETLTAWGDETTCLYCNMNRLCRKQAWSE